MGIVHNFSNYPFKIHDLKKFMFTVYCKKKFYSFTPTIVKGGQPEANQKSPAHAYPMEWRPEKYLIY
jgi:hypothetical protein